MKTIVRNYNNVSLYLFNNDEKLIITENDITVGEPPKFIIADCNSTNVTLFENVADPGDWIGWKYLYTEANGWELNPNWNPPE